MTASSPDLARQALLDRAAAMLSDRTPIYKRMREAESARGFRVVLPGAERWLPRKDWHECVVVSVDDDEVRLVAILSRRPGSFSRLLARLSGCGLSPVIVCPIGPIMPAYVRRHNWTLTTIGAGIDAEEQWRPENGKRFAEEREMAFWRRIIPPITDEESPPIAAWRAAYLAREAK